LQKKRKEEKVSMHLSPVLLLDGLFPRLLLALNLFLAHRHLALHDVQVRGALLVVSAHVIGLVLTRALKALLALNLHYIRPTSEKGTKGGNRQIKRKKETKKEKKREEKEEEEEEEEEEEGGGGGGGGGGENE
jgi:hypothetical protein